jgi:oligoendopeptidase F
MSKKLIPERKDVPDAHKWNLSLMFENDERWEEFFTETEKAMESLPHFKGRLGESIFVLQEAMQLKLSVMRKLERLYGYAHMKSDEDKANQFYSGLNERAMNLHARMLEVCSYFNPEIQALPDQIAHSLVKGYVDDDLLFNCRFYFEKILRYKPHTRSQSEEELMAMGAEMATGPRTIFGELDDVDLQFGTIVEKDGTETELSHGNFSTFMINPDRDIRKQAFHQYYQGYDDHKHTLAATLAASIKKDAFYSRARDFSSSRAKSLFSDNISEDVYDNLIETVRNNLDPLFKFLNFKKQALGLDNLHFYDTYMPIVKDVEFNISYEKAVDMCVKSVEPLGSEYCRTLKRGLLGGWVDRYENKGKRSGAYSSGCYDSSPYVLMNYEDKNLNSVYTLQHEGGHSMHTLFSNIAQPYVAAEYTIFVAEVASTFNENLLSRYLLDYFKNDPQRRVYILTREIDNIRATFFRQTMFAEFEKITHEIVKSNKPLTLEVIRDVYQELLEAYFGDTIVIDEVLQLEGLRIPHFYSAFYVYKYATGISAAIALTESVLSKGGGEGLTPSERYLEFLKLGGSKFPMDQLLEAGVDMRSPEPIKQAIDYFESLVDQLISEYKKI